MRWDRRIKRLLDWWYIAGLASIAFGVSLWVFLSNPLMGLAVGIAWGALIWWLVRED